MDLKGELASRLSKRKVTYERSNNIIYKRNREPRSNLDIPARRGDPILESRSDIGSESESDSSDSGDSDSDN